MRVSFLRAAEAEFDDAIAHYEAETPGLGLRFRAEVSRSLKRVIQFPNAYQRFGPRTRRCLIPQFPYGIVYFHDQEQGEILVVAIAHLHRKPAYWASRGAEE